MGYNPSDTLTGKLGDTRVTDTTSRTFNANSIVPETDTVFTALTILKADSTTIIDAIATKNLGSMKAGLLYLPGAGNVFKTIQLTSGAVIVHE